MRFLSQSLLLMMVAFVGSPARAAENEFPAMLLSADELRETHLSLGLEEPIYDLVQLARRDLLGYATQPSGARVSLRGIFDSVIQKRLSGGGTELCRLYGADCLTIAYLDRSERIHQRQINQNRLWMNDQLELGGILDLQTLIAEVQGRTRQGSRTQPPEYRKKFEGAKYFKPNERAQEDLKLLEPEFQKLLSSDGENAAAFSSLLLKTSRVFALLPAFHARALAQGGGALRAFERAYERALFLSLDAIYPNADFRVPTYPYDSTVDQASSPESLLSPSVAASALSSLRRWPEIRSLTLAERKARAQGDRQSVFLLRSPRGSWRVRGFYSTGPSSSCTSGSQCQRIPLIYVDHELPFYENVYLLYHELWHVVWDQSTLGEARVASLVETLRSGDVDRAREAILRYVSENELIAIDQQNRLFHANEFITSSWQGDYLYSAKGWHDSYFGIESRYEKLGKYQIQGGVPNSLFRLEFGPFGAILPGLVKLFHETWVGTQAMLRGTTDPEYWSERLKVHRGLFEDVYLGRRVDATDWGSIQTAVKMSDLRFNERTLPVLSCPELLTGARALVSIQGSDGHRWIRSLPFDFVPKNDTREFCPDLADLRERFNWLSGGNGGTHGGFDFMASFDSEVKKK